MNTLGKHVKTMLAVDRRRMFRSKLFYIMLSICLIMPIAILVMTTMMDGSVSINPQTGVETVIEGFDNVWHIIGSTSNSTISMSMTAMCNINMLYFIISVLVCVYVSEDFRSGYSKNLFAIRVKKADYIISKTIICSLCAFAMLIVFVIGSLLGGAIARLPFDMIGFTSGNLLMCIISKLLLSPIFVSIYLCASVVAKQKTWLSILLSVIIGMFLFMTIPMLTPLNAQITNVFLSLTSSVVFCIGLGVLSSYLLNKFDIL